MSCCLEDAMLDELKLVGCEYIRPENHFIGKRQCEDCVPYLVLSTTKQQLLRTSEGVTYRDAITVSAYFKPEQGQRILAYKTLLESWVSQSDCIQLVECGCFCVVNVTRSAVSDAPGGLSRYQLQFTGRYNAVSGSNSESA